MIPLIAILPAVAAVLWLLCIRPYCIRNRKGYTPGANIGVTFWVDWQEAREIAKANGDNGMILICRLVFWLQVVPVGALLVVILVGTIF